MNGRECPQFCTVWRICSRCTGFVVMATYAPNAKCQRGRIYSLRGWFITILSDGSALAGARGCLYNPTLLALGSLITGLQIQQIDGRELRWLWPLPQPCHIITPYKNSRGYVFTRPCVFAYLHLQRIYRCIKYKHSLTFRVRVYACCHSNIAHVPILKLLEGAQLKGTPTPLPPTQFPKVTWKYVQ